MNGAAKLIKQAIEAQCISIEALASRIGHRDSTIRAIAAGKAPVTGLIALELECALGIPAHELSCASAAEFAKAKIARQKFLSESAGWARLFPLRSLQKAGLIPAAYNLQHDEELTLAALRFMGFAHPAEWERHYALLAKTQNPQALSAWLRTGELQALQVQAKEYHTDAFKIALQNIRYESTRGDKDFKKFIVKNLTDAGVIFLQIPASPKTQAPRSASFTIHGNPVILLSQTERTDADILEDIFHAAGHFLKHKPGTLCVRGIPGITIRGEASAESFAEKELLPECEECEIIACGKFSAPADIHYFSTVFRVAPGIIVSRLQQQRKLPAGTPLNSLKKMLS